MLSILNQRPSRLPGYRPISSRDQTERGDPIVDDISADNVRRKIDRNILPLMMSLYGVQYLDKATLGRAAVLGFIEDNNLSVNQFNWLGAIIYLGYLLFAFPQNIALQHAPVGKWISLNIWGIAMVLQSLRLPYVGLLACRFVLGVCEGSITSGFLMVTSMFYTKSEQSSRVGYWFLMNGVAQIISNLMGYGSLHFKSNLLAPWQWFTLINGVLTFATALAFYLYFPDSISTSRFLTEEEKRIAAERVSEHETNAENKEWKPEQFKEALYDPKTWLFASFSLFNNIPTSIGIQRSLIVESLGFTRLQTTLLGTLDGVIEIITIYTGVKLVEYFGYSRAYVGSTYMVSDVLSAILVTTLPWSKKTGLLISIYLTGMCLMLPGCVFLRFFQISGLLGMSWVLLGLLQVQLGIQNAQLDSTQAIMLSAYCAGNLIGPHMWQEKYKPRNRIPWFIIGTCYSCCIVLLLVIRRRLQKENHRRDLMVEEPDDYVFTETDLTDIQNPKFRYVL
ncbi:MFS general substrate transporter [Rhizoctonia solani AG-3 Rhs1AP]|uniref:MFS general substrate transporter n=2 Tax=Rhizoctonia solani AG-3 TaxID=1086053 RepID=A0A074RPT6_9AGAM|nr:MFS general substrate transporter [Rhizoctonia solani AG-3 Rhs1AP]KEP49076.1 MFS general substrate transporter [Rhizoctonia solani 123E]